MAEIHEHHHNPNLPRAAEARHLRPPPEKWAEFRAHHRPKWLLPLWYIDWLAEWAAWGLSRLSMLELLEHLGSCSLLIGLAVYLWEAPERGKTRHYQAWQVINTAQGKGGSGGRIEAMHELNEDHVPLVGIDVSAAFLQGVRLEKADLHRGDFHVADMRDVDLRDANLQDCIFSTTNLEGADLSGADLSGAILSNADLSNAKLVGADLNNVDLAGADLRGADLSGVKNATAIKSFHLANIHGLKNAPDGFAAAALGQGAVDLASDAEWEGMVKAERKAAEKQPPSSQP
jgi:hypothetical protein